MDRRIAIKNLALILSGATLFPKGLLAGNEKLIQLKNVTVTPAQEKLLANICETIIPKTTTPGAKDLNLHLFVLTMLDDCYSKADQDAFAKGLEQFEKLAAQTNSKPFALWPAAQRETLLTSLEQKNDQPAELNRFYRIVKDKTIQGYTQSQYFMTKQVVYELVPARYLVNVPVKKTTKVPSGKHG
ncbi:gluconate 2-dehydrogenase subunit 3 family protein [Mucilaginibacter limnophilus]|uniref:Gluconate 2-dehydrogenase subunit 3 family protein n=1 Tax=Mucilaginibacter limnophilus TaxID=1932778 RepID=A0A3S2Y311_9SPHI|nr:gluconate 2-dehydrogenase subunit 3 family protein [Mucilaginibacter limnophilus]RVU00739.1 gluconate 2-dehydrogenase subunit 3 family protein [Mucilaginibacter limnophilus]